MRTLKKKPIQIYLDVKQNNALEYFAKKLGASKAELVRRSVDDFLKKRIPLEKDPALEIVGLAGKVGISDMSDKHDEYIIKFERRRQRKK